MKQRIDQLLVEKGLAPSRERAQSMIMAGLVLVNDVPVTKSGHKVAEDAVIRVKGHDHPYVGRGGVKLAGALDHFKINPKDTICADIGSSTGGFTDCLLQRGAAKVYAVDVGTNQLAWKLREDPRVVVMEKTHVKELQPSHFPNAPLLIVIDCSFISLARVLPELVRWVAPHATVLALIKPQFEVGPDKIGKGGIVKDDDAQKQAIDGVLSVAADLGWSLVGVCDSPITGTDGNREYFACFHS
ncbi:MAG: TlyA family rRNA (cytidine-2'-O)-methyltransferase [Deltaproteobacteria bacterium CG11_big_fil_rev_8_21_14_0_20_47_16]|nr:MAG: TlyA family rRNA (cytidine-2'-O)-methyltransferase [Deltaproteobacteria bacterium CG11_big_fil_rev_8_21_14_0_20_47_16]